MGQKQNPLNQPIDISEDFFEPDNEYYIAGSLARFDKEKAEGEIQWNYHRWVNDSSFNKAGRHLKPFPEREIFWNEYETNPRLHFSLSFINSRTIRLRMKTTASEAVITSQEPSLMLNGEPVAGNSWQPAAQTGDTFTYQSEHGSIVIDREPWKLSIYNASGELLTSTIGTELFKAMHPKTIPFLFTQRISDTSRSIAASFSLYPDEKIYGCGESFTALNKRGQKLVLFTTDTQSAATGQIYKPIPFFISSRGHGMFLHSSSPVTMDFAHLFDGSKIIYCGEDQLDLFFFIGSPAEILSAYTAITGRSPLPPLWSFGLWMSRFTYSSQTEVLQIADKLRKHQIPCDVIHIDAGWFEKGINCDYCFDKKNFPDPPAMIAELKEKGFRTSLWQIPYYSPRNPVFSEVVQKNLFIKNNRGGLATEDAILDFSNPQAREWYAEKIESLLRMGVSVIKADFGEAAPVHGWYASGKSGFYEHNAYPLRYTQLLNDITQKITGENIIWARSAWAGGQRNPVHWSGDPEVSDTGMAGTLRAGLSLGLSGFSFWSHDMGGFSSAPEEELFKRWAFFGLLSSHSRIHGLPPREPWEFSEDFLNTFRKIAELKYRLMPYIYTQAALASKHGLPLLKALLLNYPDDPTCWYIDDQYLLGDHILVAPLMEKNKNSRIVYLPEGKWTDYQTRKVYEGKQWVTIVVAELPGIMLVENGSLIPHIELAQSTAFINWDNIELMAVGDDDGDAKGQLYFADASSIVELQAKVFGSKWKLVSKGFPGIFTFKESVS